jgi:tetratricopeptide (TPR) repeat protein
MIDMAGLSLSTQRGRKQYASLTGAVNIVDASFTRIGKKMDSLLMSGWISSLETGSSIETLDDVRCSAENPMECIQAFASNIKGYWASRKDKVLTPPNYEAYKAFMAAKAAWGGEDKIFLREQLDKAIRLDPGFIDPYFLLLDYFYNKGLPQEAYDTIQAIRMKFTEMDAREKYMFNYHAADVDGKNDEAYNFFLNEYRFDPKNLFVNSSAMVMAIMYRHNPHEAIRFFRDIPFDSLNIEDCPYCLSRVELAMWVALEADSMALADALAPKIAKNLIDRKAFGTLIMYYVSKNDTIKINQLITDSRNHPKYAENWEYLTYLTGRLFKIRGNNELPIRYARKGIEIYKPKPSLFKYLARSYELDNQLDKALATYKEGRKEYMDDLGLLGEMGGVYAQQGNIAEAKKTIEQLEKMRKPFDYGSVEYHQGRINALLGESKEAVRLLDVSISKGMKLDLWITFEHDPGLLVLKDDPGYKAMMSRFK